MKKSLILLLWLGVIACRSNAQDGTINFDGYSPDKTGTSDVSVILQQALDACAAKKGILLISAGTYKVSQTVYIRGAITIRGSGKATSTQRGVTRFVSSSNKLDLLLVDAGGNNIVLEDFSVENTSPTAATAGTGIRIVNADGTVMNRISVINFYNNISVEKGIYWKMDQCSIFDPVNYGVWIRHLVQGDVGDMSITACEFVTQYFITREPVAAVQWQSSGGLRFVNNKINWAGGSRWQNGIRIMPDSVINTSVFLINSNSIENCTNYGLYVGGAKAPGYIINALIVTGNEFGITGTSIFLDLPQRAGGVDAQALQSVEISGNQLYGGSVSAAVKNDNVGWGIRAENVGNLSIGTNHYMVASGAVRIERCHNVSYLPGNLRHNGVSGGLTLYENATAGFGEYTQGNLTFDYSRDIPIDITGTINLYDLWLYENRGYIVTVECTGLAPSTGLFALKTTKYISQTTADTNPVMATIGTDTNLGNAADLILLPSANKMTFQIRRKNGGSLQGFVRLTISGPLSKITQY